ncbi:MAG: APH(3') family aminoglycoside O-phosphotransferase [Candidatus Odinarchaeota archaeon]
MTSHAALNFELPPDLQEIIRDYNWERNTTSGTPVNVFRLTTSNSPSFYLKINSPRSGFDLSAEKERLKWLTGKLSVPRVLYYARHHSKEYLLLSELKGVPSHDSSLKKQRLEVVSLLARGLHLIHSVDISSCPFDNSLEVQTRRAISRMESGFVNEKQFDAKRQGKTAFSLYQELLATKIGIEDLIFTHGDYCLPNILIYDGKLSGFIDMGNAGISDRYQDVALCVRSITYNFGEKLVPIFLQEYGLETVDWHKIEFYQLLDEFF